MRYLVKGDSGIPFVERADIDTPEAPRWRHHLVRRLLAVLCLLLMGYFGYQLLHAGSSSSSIVVDLSPEWGNPTGLFSWLKWRVSGFRWQVRRGLEGTLPNGEWGLILKFSFCAVAAAVFLRAPQRT